MNSAIPARLACTWKDGTPRLSPAWFHWNGSEFVFGGPPRAPKTEALPDGSRVAVTIDTDTMPYKVPTIRGSIRSDLVEGVPPEYVDAAKRTLGNEGGTAWSETIGNAFPTMARLFVRPEWVGGIDFEQRFPNEVERALERLQAQARAPGSFQASRLMERQIKSGVPRGLPAWHDRRMTPQVIPSPPIDFA